MSDEAPSDDEIVMFAAVAAVAAATASGLEFIRWLQRRVWIMRGVTLMNVGCMAFNASNLGDRLWWLAAAGIVLNAWGACKAVKVEIDFQQDIKKTRGKLRDLDQKMKAIERVRHES